MTIQSEISKIRKTFPYGKIKKIYEMPNELIIIKFKPKDENTFPYIKGIDKDYHMKYYYCPAHLFSKDPYQTPWRFKSYTKLINELLKTGRINDNRI